MLKDIFTPVYRYFVDSLYNIWINRIYPLSPKGFGAIATMWTKVNDLHLIKKAVEMAALSMESMYLVGVIIFEAVYGTRPKNAKYPSPWKHFRLFGNKETTL